MDPSTNQPIQPLSNPNVLSQPQPDTAPLVQTSSTESLPAASVEVQSTNPVEQAPSLQVKSITPTPVQAANQPVQPQAQVWSNEVHTDAATAREIHAGIADLAAEDVDLIEKPWVDITEKVIATDKDDPYAEDEHQHDINKAYVKKRFNLDVS